MAGSANTPPDANLAQALTQAGIAAFKVAGTGTSLDGKWVIGAMLIDPDTGAVYKAGGGTGGGAVNPAAGAVVALTTPSGTLSSGDNALAVASAVRHIWIENNSAAAINYAMDGAASAGTRQCPAGSARILDEPCSTAIHIFVGGSTPYNGSSGSNVVVLAWA